MIQRKEQAGRALGNNENFAQFYGSAQTPHNGGTMHFNEYVPSNTDIAADNVTQAQRDAAANTGRNARAALAQHGFEGHDIRRGNMITDTRTGQNKVVDYVPAKPGEMETPDLNQPSKIQVTPAGNHLINFNGKGSSREGMLGNLLGGKPMPAPSASAQASQATNFLPSELLKKPSAQANQATGFLGPKPSSQANQPTGFLGPKTQATPAAAAAVTQGPNEATNFLPAHAAPVPPIKPPTTAVKPPPRTTPVKPPTTAVGSVRPPQ